MIIWRRKNTWLFDLLHSTATLSVFFFQDVVQSYLSTSTPTNGSYIIYVQIGMIILLKDFTRLSVIDWIVKARTCNLVSLSVWHFLG